MPVTKKYVNQSNNLLVKKTGFSRRMLALIAGSLGAIGIAVVVFSHASAAAPVPCSPAGSGTGGAHYNCGFYTTAPVVNSGGAQVGTVHAGTNWVICQLAGKQINVGSYYNIYWAYTESDQNTWGWVNAVYGKGGGNDGAWGGVPACTTQGSPPAAAAAVVPAAPTPTPAPATANASNNYLVRFGPLSGGQKNFYRGGFTIIDNSNGSYSVLTFQTDGNLVFYRNNAAVWASNTYNRGYRLALQNDGNVVVYNSSNQAVWAANTYGAASKYKCKSYFVDVFSGHAAEDCGPNQDNSGTYYLYGF